MALEKVLVGECECNRARVRVDAGATNMELSAHRFTSEYIHRRGRIIEIRKRSKVFIVLGGDVV